MDKAMGSQWAGGQAVASEQGGHGWGLGCCGTYRETAVPGLLGPGANLSSGRPQLEAELAQEQESKQRLEGEQRETESNWEAQLADILSWWVPGVGRGGEHRRD